MKPQVITWLPAIGPYFIPANMHFTWPHNFAEDGANIIQKHKTLFGTDPGPIIGNSYDRVLLNHSDDFLNGQWSPRFDHGIAEVGSEFSSFLDLFIASGCKLSHYVGDGESGRCFWNLSADNMKSLDTDPAYAALVSKYPDMPKQPSTLDATKDRDGVVAFNAGLAAACDTARKAAFVDVLSQKIPTALMSDFNAVYWLKQDVQFVPDANGWPQWSYDTPMTALAPVIYAGFGNEKYFQPLYGQPYHMAQWQINDLIETAKNANGRPLWPWVAVLKLSNVFSAAGGQGELYYEAMIACALIISGGQLLYFNYDDTSPEQDARITKVCAAYEAATNGRAGGKALISANPFITLTNTAFAVTWQFADKDTMSYAVLAPNVKKSRLGLPNGKVIEVSPEDGVGCWR